VELEKVRAIAEELKSLLAPWCHRIEIVGDIRGQKPAVTGIELLYIPKYFGIANENDSLDQCVVDLMMAGVMNVRRAYGPKKKLMMHIPSGIAVDIFTTDAQCWAVALAVKTGGAKTKKRIAAARRKGWRFRVNGDGFDTPDGHITCSTEREVFETVGLPYLPPEQRE
jgi:DNA polymerase/3'-5' exonuclease PolX